MLAEILLNLSPLDRLYSAPTSRRFVQAVSESRMLHDVRFEIPYFNRDAAIDALRGSQRHYRNLKLHRGERLLVPGFFETRVLLVCGSTSL